MTNRTVIGLAVALVVLGALALLGQREPQETTAGSGLLAPGLQAELDQVTRMEVIGAGGIAVATLERNADGWSIQERGGYPADLTKVRHTLLSLAEARILEAKTANPDWYDRLGVESVESNDAGGVFVTLDGIDTALSLIVGDTAGDYQAYVRRPDDAQSYLIDRDPEVGRTAADWLDTELLTIAGDRVQSVTVSHPDGEVLNVSKDAPEQTNFSVDAVPEGRELQYDSVANVMGNVLGNLSLQDVEPLEETDERVTVTEFRTFGGLSITASSLERDDEAWVSFVVGYEPPAAPSEEDTGSPAESTVDVQAEAEQLDQRLSGWRYRIATYQFDQMTRRMSDLLRSLPEETAE